MHPAHLPQYLLLFLLTLTPPALALPEPHQQQQQQVLDPPPRPHRLPAFLAQKPLHTTALLAGAAATALPAAQIMKGRRRDLSGVTGEKGIWVPAEFCDEGEGGWRKGGDVRGERVLEVGLEDEDLEGEGEGDGDGDGGFGVGDVVGWVWRGWERVGGVLQGGMKRVGMDDGHDGDL